LSVSEPLFGSWYSTSAAILNQPSLFSWLEEKHPVSFPPLDNTTGRYYKSQVAKINIYPLRWTRRHPGRWSQM